MAQGKSISTDFALGNGQEVCWSVVVASRPVAAKAALGAAARSSPVTPVSSPSKKFESHWLQAPISDVETCLAGLRFEKRYLLDELPGELVGDNPNRQP